MSGIPQDLIDKLQAFDEKLSAVEDLVDKITEGGVDKHYERKAHDMAIVDSASMFLMDSLLWATHGLKGKVANQNDELMVDLARTKRMTADMKEVNERQDAPRINQQAAQNFVRNALWEVPDAKK
ncbi:unnamed protein product [Caenorhabditis angaria]|uniref:Nuclear nucleic acid-binding protein C1D n=1 Tax=Caenorhabditis angaria TaxID=860376 RepID=A0A9P1IBH7_9PELO|nr:unnamed protein product [Caenorhabditis angaria]